ncbi:MAG TPA: glycosyltransferase family 2 protein [Verrucomicrobiae bacterium]|nr:glycosyltransferase family 2 protein [Verrucomicrobiae bacterium]
MTSAQTQTVDLSIVIPCLNEAETIGRCVEKAVLGMQRAGVSGEIVVADNGSSDGSRQLAERAGARVVPVAEKGYGNALRGGILAARGRWIIMGDADDTYDFSQIQVFVDKLREGCDVVMGCRMPRGGGTVMPGAMPWKNRYIGNPILSFIGKLLFRTPINDFHCGLRAFSKDAFARMDLKTTGMEFASEMVMKASLESMRMAEAPVTLYPDPRNRTPHLRPWRDGWRHLRLMLIFSPRWLFLMPGLALCAAGLVVGALTYQPLRVGPMVFDVGTLTVACMWVIIGIQFISFGCFTKVFAIAEGLLPEDPKFTGVFRYINLERGIVLGAAIVAVGLAMLIHALLAWEKTGYGVLDYGRNLRRLIPAAALMVIGVQTISASFFMSILGLKTRTRRPPGARDEK